jgi:ABC-type glycerol-3-phosphate transport system substrate-binding protein
VSPRRISIAALLACALLAGCGGDDSSSDENAPPAAKAQDFPKPGGKSLRDLLK